MAYFIKEEQFNGMFNLVIEDGSFFQDYAQQWEELNVPKLFGYDMWNRYLTEHNQPEMQDFTEQCERLLKHFFYYDYSVEVESYQSTIGNMTSDVENAERNRLARNHKMVQLWNIGVDTYVEVFGFLRDLETYPQLPDEPYPIVKQNVFGI